MKGDHPRRAAVSSYGLSGTNVHVVLEQAPQVAPRTVAQDSDAESALTGRWYSRCPRRRPMVARYRGAVGRLVAGRVDGGDIEDTG